MTDWERFFRQKCIEIFTTSSVVIDIGGSLRIDKNKGSRFDKGNAWILPYAERVAYKILDPVEDYNPDIIGDIHNLPFDDDTQEAILCLAVLEHVENPIKGMEELHRVLKPGGKLLVYVPFLYYYHAHPGYYNDYWRFTEDTIQLFAKPFSKSELAPVRLPIETLIRLTPFGRYKIPITFGQMLDRFFYRGKSSKQVSGYYVYLEK